jgi:anaerobic selenocysteine-containing dehydrogenase
MLRSACTRDCPDACSLLLDTSKEQIAVKGNPEHPITEGVACSKVHKHLRRIESPFRISLPRYKTPCGWREIAWPEVWDLLAEQVVPILETEPERLLHIQGHGSRGISKDVCDHFFAALGCSKTYGSLCDGTGIQASIQDFGDLDHNDVRDILNSKRIVNWGRDLSRSSVHLARLVQKARSNGGEVISISPGGQSFQNYSDHLIRVAPGRDRFLALAVIKLLKRWDLLDKSSEKTCTGWDKFWEILGAHSLDDLCTFCEVQRGDVQLLAEMYARPPVATLIGWGLQRYINGAENVRAIDALAWLSGSVGQIGGGVYFNISSLRNLDYSWLPGAKGRSLCMPDLAGEILRTREPRLSMAWIAGTNVVNQVPDSEAMARALENLDFVVVTDAFMTDTADCADLVLPSTLMWEEEDVLGSCMHDFLQYTPAVLQAPEGCRSDLDIARKLDALLGQPIGLPERDICFANSLRVHGGRDCLHELKARGFYQARNKLVVYSKGTEHPGGCFQLLDKLTPEPESDADYPFYLLSLIRREATHSQILPEEQGQIPRIWVNPESWAIKSLQGKSPVWLISELGRIKVQIEYDPTLHPRVVVYRRGDWRKFGGGVNRLIKSRLTDVGWGAAYYSQRVRLEDTSSED